MWGTEPELLIVLDRSGAQPWAALAALGPVTSTLRPRLALLAVPASRAPEIGALPGVRGVFTGPLPPELRDTFTAAECLFVDGWLARTAPKHREPPGGEPWDTPGRLPPDPPPAR